MPAERCFVAHGYGIHADWPMPSSARFSATSSSDLASSASSSASSCPATTWSAPKRRSASDCPAISTTIGGPVEPIARDSVEPPTSQTASSWLRPSTAGVAAPTIHYRLRRALKTLLELIEEETS